MYKKTKNLYRLLFLCTAWLYACDHDILLEFKGAYFLSTSKVFREIYNNGGCLFGPEVTFKLMDCLYGFASIDYLTKSGHSIGLCDYTRVNLLPLGIGLKYMESCCDNVQLYVGLGFQPVRLQTKNCSPFVIQNQKKWGFGGIAKIGAYVDLPCHFLLDFFIDYSFVKVKCGPDQSCTGYVEPRKANLSGVVFGAGLGYRFN